jgi:DNA-binding NtrC family response regulator
MTTFRYATVSHRSGYSGVGLLRAKSILIVEDEPLIALELHAALRAAGASLMAATDATEALRIIRRNDVSAAVVDVSLGNEDCLAVCQALFYRSVPFLFYTGHRDAAILSAWPEAPVYLKPARSEDIIACLADLAS